MIFVDGREFIPTVWNGSYVCDDNQLNISYVVNLTKSEINFGISGTLYIEGLQLPIQGTFAWYQGVLALQHQYYVASLVYGNNFTYVEIDMNLINLMYMRGAVVFSTSSGIKTCTSEMRRVAGMLIFRYFNPKCINCNKSRLLFSFAEMFKKPLWQTVWTQTRLLPIGAVCSGSTLFASILNLSVILGNYLQQTTSASDIFRCIFFLAL